MRRWLAGMIDVAIPVGSFWLMWPVAIVVVTILAMVVGLAAATLLPVPLLLGFLLGVIVNELAFPQARGWTLGMLVTGLRIAPASVRGSRLLLRSGMTWGSILVVYVGADLVRWELFAIGARPYLWDALLGPPNPFSAAVTFGWTLVLTFPVGGRPLLDRVAGWQVTDRAARSNVTAPNVSAPSGPVSTGAAPNGPVSTGPAPNGPVPNGRGGRSIWIGALVVLAGLVVSIVLLVVAVVVVFVLQNPGPVGQVESDLRHAATALEVYHRNHGRYAEEALESSYWGYHRTPEVSLEVHVSADGQRFCLEGFHMDSAGRVSTYDSVGGLDREASC